MERWVLLLLLILQLDVLPSQCHRWRKHQNRAFRCREEGLFRHPTNCAKFHRCVFNENHLQYTTITISCPNGLVYNDKIKSCSTYSASRRCQTVSDQFILNRTKDFQETQWLPCEKEGFFAHPHDCKKFYRCTDYEGKGKSYSAFEYHCPDKLMFNKELKACDWPRFSPPCGTDVEEHRKPSMEQKKAHKESTRDRIHFSDKRVESDNTVKCKKEGFFRNPTNCKKFYRCVSFPESAKRHRNFKIYHFTCPQGLIFDEKLSTCNWPAKDSSCEVRKDETTQSSAKTTPSYLERQKPTQGPPAEVIPCHKEGFFRHPRNCSKFFRCVKIGHKYRSYVFSCPKNLVFDEDTNSCNWPHASSPCKDNFVQLAKPPLRVIVSAHHFRDKNRSNRYPRSYQTAPSLPYLSSVFYETPRRTVTGSFVAKHGPGSNLTCEKEGVFKHPQYCHEFFVCSDFNNDQKTYTIFEFVCPNDMVYDETIDDCAEPPPDSPCAHHQPQECKHDGSGSTSTSSTDSSDSTTKSTKDDSAVTKDEETTESTAKPTQATEDGITTPSGGSESTTSPSTSGKEEKPAPIKCEKSGFFRHPEDCNRFYRCVDMNNDGKNFVVYEFRCGDGLVFDEINSVCNWPSAVPSCDSSSTSGKPSEGTDGQTTPVGGSEDGKVTDGKETGTDSKEGNGSTSTPDDTGSNESTKCDDDDSTKNPEDQTSSSKSEETDTGSTASPGDGSTKSEETDTGSTASAGDGSTKSEETDTGSTGSTGGGSTKSEETDTGSTGSPGDGTGEVSTSVPGSGSKDTSTDQTSGIECKKPGFFRNPTNCSKFYRCVNDSDDGKSFRIFHFDCPSNLVFDEELSVCNWPDQAKPPCKVTEDKEHKDDKDVTSSESTSDDGSDNSIQSTTASGQADQPSSTPPSKPEGTGEGLTTVSGGESETDCPDGDNKDATDGDDKEASKQPTESGSTTGPDSDSKDATDGDNKEASKQPTESGSTTGPDSDNKDATDGENKEASKQPTEGGSTASPDSKDTDSKGSDSSSIECTKAGFFRNPNNCSKFYRCVGGRGNFRIYHFECPSNLVFDESTSVCNWPNQAQPPCKLKGNTEVTDKDEEKAGDSGGSPSTERTTASAADDSSLTTKGSGENTEDSSGTSESKSTPQSDEESTTSSSSAAGDQANTQEPEEKESETPSDDKTTKPQEGPECKKEGFYRNPKNCSKFYRCVDHTGSGKKFQIYHFDCPSNLVFDEVLSVCNWPDQAQPPCEQGSATEREDGRSTEVTPEATSSPSDRETSSSKDDDTAEPSKMPGDDSSTAGPESSSGLPSDQTMQPPSATDMSKEQTDQTAPIKDRDSTGSRDEVTLSTEPTSDPSIGVSSTTDSTSGDRTSEDDKSKDGAVECKEEGFFRHPKDCRKFYRCVDFHNSSKSFTIYHFECPANTMFDDILDVCVWPQQVRPPCDMGSPVEDKEIPSSEKPGKDDKGTTSMPVRPDEGGDGITSLPKETKDDKEDRVPTTVGAKEEETTTPQSEKPATEPSAGSTTPRREKPCPPKKGEKSTTSKPDEGLEDRTSQPSTDDDSAANDCNKEGFFREESDCSAFYRCVDYGDGKTFKRYNFVCPNNTVFDDVLDVCVWPGQEKPQCPNKQGSEDEKNNIISDGEEKRR